MLMSFLKACGGLCVLAVVASSSAVAEPVAAPTLSVPSVTTPNPAKNYDLTLYERLTTEKKSLYQQIGGHAVLEGIMKNTVSLIKQDPRIAKYFEKTDSEVLAYHLTEQVCQLSGGECEYLGRSMEESHKGMGVTDAAFVALVEDFQIAVRQAGLTFEQENKLVALLAPMRPVIVNQ